MPSAFTFKLGGGQGSTLDFAEAVKGLRYVPDAFVNDGVMQYRLALVPPTFGPVKDRRLVREVYQVSEILARMNLPGCQALSGVGGRSEGFGAAREYVGELCTMLFKDEVDLNPMKELGCMIAPFELVEVPGALRAYVEADDAARAEPLAVRAGALAALWLCFFDDAEFPSPEMAYVDACDRVFRGMTSDLFPHGIKDDAFQFHFAALRRDLGQHVALGLSLDAELRALQDSFDQERILTGSSVDATMIHEMYRITGRWLKRNVHFYQKSRLDSEDLLESDRSDAFQYKCDAMFKAKLVCVQHRERIQRLAGFCRLARPIVDRATSMDFSTALAIAEPVGLLAIGRAAPPTGGSPLETLASILKMAPSRDARARMLESLVRQVEGEDASA